MTERASPAARVVWFLVAVLTVLHFDFWWWDDDTLLFGYLPIGLASQGVISLVAAILWASAVRFAWPAWIEDWADDVQPEEEPQRRGGDVR